jgi:hypothetical protein
MKLKITLILLSLFALLFLVVWNLLEKKNQIIEKNQIENENSFMLEESAYQAGFREGFFAFMKQTGQYTPSLNTTSAIYEYTKSKYEKKDEDNEENLQGYVDGYHKATESMHCPRYSH